VRPLHSGLRRAALAVSTSLRARDDFT
jgi:hypothetical protein